jgi:hypothetical protein
VALDKHKNVAVMSTKSGIKRYSVFATTVTGLEPSVCCFVATGAPHESVPEVTDAEDSDDGSTESTTTSSTADSEDEDVQPDQVDFDQNRNVPGVSMENDVPLNRDKDELYRLHVKLHEYSTLLRTMGK